MLSGLRLTLSRSILVKCRGSDRDLERECCLSSHGEVSLAAGLLATCCMTGGDETSLYGRVSSLGPLLISVAGDGVHGMKFPRIALPLPPEA